MNFDSLLIVTYGRTGSTLLMGVLNALPGVLIRGENMNLCAGLFHAYKSLVATKSEHGGQPQDSTRPFHGADLLSPARFLLDMRAALQKQLLSAAAEVQVQCWGFKEIRYTPDALTQKQGYELEAYLSFLSELMPKPGFIFLTRDHTEVADSAFWKRRETDAAKQQMRQFEAAARRWSQNRTNSFFVDYKDLTVRSNRLAELFDFVGAHLPRGQLESVLAREHSYAGKDRNLGHVVERQGQTQTFVEKRDSPQVLVARLDPISTPPQAGVPFDVGGVILPKSRQPLTLSVKGCASTPTIRTGLPSPMVGKHHATHPSSKMARVQIRNLVIAGPGPLEIACVLENGTEETLFCIRTSDQAQQRDEKTLP